MFVTLIPRKCFSLGLGGRELGPLLLLNPLCSGGITYFTLSHEGWLVWSDVLLCSTAAVSVSGGSDEHVVGGLPEFDSPLDQSKKAPEYK
jgi:hypothetical protein